jgi:hypothetical protein
MNTDQQPAFFNGLLRDTSEAIAREGQFRA